MKLVVLEPLGVERKAFLEMGQQALGNRFEIESYDTRAEDTATLIQRAKEADVVVLSNIPFGEEVMSQCPNLKFVCVAFTGVDHIDLAYCRERGIVVSNCSGYATTAVVELVFGLILGLYRRLLPCDQTLRQGGTKEGLVGFELAGKNVGIIGAGAIGLGVAKVAQAFGCQVSLYNGGRSVEYPGMKTVSLEELLARCDIVSLHTPLTTKTKGLIGREQLALMKPTALLINTARGPVVDSAALADALRVGQIAGAGLDVFDTEPPISVGDPLLTAPNTLLTPHVAFATAESMVKRGMIAFENISQWANGTPQNVIG